MNMDFTEEQSTRNFQDYRLEDTYRAQIESAMKAGWDDPVMDEYNNYDSKRKP